MPAWPFPESHHRERPMTFEFTTPTNAKLTEVDVLSDKDREPGTNPGTALDFTITTGNDVLTMLDGRLRHTIYEKNANSSPSEPPKQGTLDLPAAPTSDLPDLTEIGKRLGQFGWDLELTGYTLTCDHGIGGKSNIELTDCKVILKSVLPKQGGSVTMKLRVEAPDVNEKLHGKVAMLKTLEFPITLLAPEVVQQDIESKD